ncbi:MAG: hypothetical protein Tsb0020_26620 [Haliangiales bacterium]
MTESFAILVLASADVDEAAAQAAVVGAGHQLLALARSLAEAAQALVARTPGDVPCVLLVERGLVDETDRADEHAGAGAAGAGGGPWAGLAHWMEATRLPRVVLLPSDAGDEPVAPIRAGRAPACVLAARELALAVALAAWMRPRGSGVVSSDAPASVGSIGLGGRDGDLAEALRQSELRYQRLIGEAPVFIWEESVIPIDEAIEAIRAQGVTDIGAFLAQDPMRVIGMLAQNRIMSVNESALRHFGARDLTDLQEHFADIFVPDSVPSLVAGVAAYAQGVRYWEFEADYRKLSGERMTLLCRFVFPTPEMSRRVVIWCGVDVTARKRSEEEIRKLNRVLEERTVELQAINEELESFSYSVSHDLRAPLRAIDGFSKILLDKYQSGLDERGQMYLNRVRDASQRMGQLIDDLLTLSRLSSSEMKVTRCDLSALAAEVVDELRQSKLERVGPVEVVIADGLVAEADPVLLRAALENLIGNAWKFTSKTEGARIEMGVGDVAELAPASVSAAGSMSAGRAAFFVRDNGAGFDMAYAEKLFEAFQRLHTQQEFAGTGVGLATVRRIMRRHGGDIWAHGEVGRGALFAFTLDS